jgi:hypothetical protein
MTKATGKQRNLFGMKASFLTPKNDEENNGATKS